MKFPLILSCGHSANTACECWRDYRKTSFISGDSPIDQALIKYQNQWRQLLDNYGCQLPRGKNHGPCPICGGKDRFRFDDKDGRGTWYCSQCDPQSGGGLMLLARYLGKTTLETAKELVGDDVVKSVAPSRNFVSDEDRRKLSIEAAKKGAQSLLNGAVVRQHNYMTNKGLLGEWLTNGDVMIAPTGERIQPGDLLLIPCYKNGELINCQKITKDGIKRPITGGDMCGVYHKIDGKTGLIGIAEGFASAVTVNRMTGATTYAAFNTGNLAAVGQWARSQHPDSRIVFFADHDELDKVHNWRPGEHYANQAAAPIQAIVALPPELGDWDDYRQKYGEEQTKSAMRSAIAADMAKQDPVKVVSNPIEQAEPKQQKPNTSAAVDTPKAEPKQKHKQRKDLPFGIDFDGMDIDSPPGLAGDIVRYIKSGASRELKGGAYASMALQCMAMAGAGIKGLNGVKLSLITLTLGMSAAGKEHPQRVIKALLDANGRQVYGDIRSDKDVIRSAIYDNGKCFYVVDEAQKILTSGSSANKHMTNVVSTLMELSTTSCYKLSQLHRDEFISQLDASASKYDKMITAKEDALAECNPDLDGGKIIKLKQDVEFYKAKREQVNDRIASAMNGVKNPSLNLLAYSTPQKLASIVDEDSIESGFLGRSLICDCGVERAVSSIEFKIYDDTATETKLDPEFERLKAEIGMICQLADDIQRKSDVESQFIGKGFRYKLEPQALEDLKAIHAFYELHEWRNHARLGSIYARFLERVLSLSSILAIGNITGGEAVVTSEFVRYSLMLIINSTEHLASNLRINEGATEQTMDAKLDAVKEAILKRIRVDRRDGTDGWRYKSEIKDYLKRRKFYQVIQAECQKSDQDAFNNALLIISKQIETSTCGMKIRLKR